MIDWKSEATHILLNPRAPGIKADEIEARLNALRPLKAHVFVATSGSTAQVSGELKWVALSKAAILASADSVNRHLSSDTKDVWAHTLPEFHVGGMGIYARAYLSGARVSRLESWSPLAFHKLCEEQGATLSALVPAQVHDLIQLGFSAPESLRAIVVGGGALAEPLYRAARKLGYPVLPSYGATECCSQVATALGEDPALKILPHFEVATDETGRFRFRGPSVLTGYAVLSENGDRWFDPKVDGWFVSEDFGSVQQGALKIQGRSADFLKIGGESSDLSALEKILDELKLSERPSFDIALVAVDDTRLGQVLHGAATPSDEKEIEHANRIFSRFNDRVLPFERARRLHFLSKLPRSPLGKLLRGELSAILRELPESASRSPK